MSTVRAADRWTWRAMMGRVAASCVLVAIVAGCGDGGDADPVGPRDTAAAGTAVTDTSEGSTTPASAASSPGSGSVASSGSASSESDQASATGTGTGTPEPTTVTVQGLRVNLRCTGQAGAAPTVVLLAGMPEPLTTFADLQTDLSRSTRVCSYDRPGEGASDAPAGPVSLTDSAAVLADMLTAAKVDGPVVLVGHSLGGLVAAQFAHDQQDRTAGVLLLDATPPSMVPGLLELIPDSADGIAAQARAEMTAMGSGENPERLVFDGEPIGTFGAAPLTVVRHGKPIYEQIPEYGPGIEKLWTQGQQQWLDLSSDSTEVVAETSGHYIYQDQPDLVLELAEAMITG